MSLFKCREWWRAPPCPGEEFDMGSLCVANIDNEASGALKVVTGSLQGMLRVFCPAGRDYAVDHQMLEVELDGAVLQLAAGHFTSNHPGTTLAVLHPRSMAVYTVAAVLGGGGGATHFDLRKVYEHHLEHSAANMCHGSFGNKQGVESICVQSLDGQLSFFEGEAISFKRFLPNFLLPGPLAYVPDTDSFVTANSGMVLESYKFSVLAASSGEKPSEPASGPAASLTQTKKLQADWSVIVGENVLDIRTMHFSQGLSPSQVDILVLGEHNVYILSEQGQVRMQKRLDYPPACICSYPNGSRMDGGRPLENLILGSSTANLLVYRETQLVWCAACDDVPVALCVGEFGGLQGLVVSLSDAGALTLSYLGTSPPLNVAAGNESKELDYVAMDEEHRHLLSVIRSATGSVRSEPKERLQLRAQVPTVLDQHSSGGWGGGDGAPSVTVRVYVNFIGTGSADNIAIAVSAPSPLAAQLSQSIVPSVSGRSRTPAIVPVTVSLEGDTLPAGNTVTVTATYLKDGNNPRVAVCHFQVPMVLLCTAIPPVKNAAFKITLDTNRLPPSMPALFDDVLATAPAAAEAARSSGGNALSFQCCSGEVVTVLVSKNAGRYRLQSDQFEAMWLVADELCRRLAAYYEGPGAGAGGGSGPFAVTYTDALPLQDYWAVIDAHFAARGDVLATRRQLSNRAAEFRSIQKRLLVRFKDRNPAPLGNMDALMEATYNDILQLADVWDQQQAVLEAAAAALSGATQLLLLLIRFCFQLDAEADAVLRAHLSPVVEDTVVVPNGQDAEIEFHGWEEATESAMTQLLRSCLARSAKESAAQPAPVAQMADTSRLRKHIGLVLERLSKGGQLAA